MSDTQEKIDRLQQEINLKKQKIKKLKQQESQKARRERTHRLIELGALIETFIGPDNNTAEYRKLLSDFLRSEITFSNGSKGIWSDFLKFNIDKLKDLQ